jgi:hypothetical protein
MKSAVTIAGTFTDELSAASVGSGPRSIGATGSPLDERLAPEGETDLFYGSLQGMRADATQAIGLLAAYAPATSPALRGEMYALQGYAELMLAEFYCSGVPLSTLDFQQDFTYKPGSTTNEVYQHARTLFDSALAISSDSPSVMGLARVGKGRALLGMDSLASAAQAVAAVPTEFLYQVPVAWGMTGVRDGYTFVGVISETDIRGLSVATHEGGNGLPFVTANDPRVLVTPAQVTVNPPSDTNQFGVPLFIPNKYPEGSTAPVVLASGVEARLIEAEAALNAGKPSWLTVLNALRTTSTTCTVQTTPCSASAGSGGVAELPLLVDPGSSAGDTARVNLLFTERAHWLFLTGHRQEDLRRLVRNYGRAERAVYPSGPYYGGIGVYGGDVNLPIPTAEQANPLFHGCKDRGA